MVTRRFRDSMLTPGDLTCWAAALPDIQIATIENDSMHRTRGTSLQCWSTCTTLEFEAGIMLPRGLRPRYDVDADA